MTELQNTKIAKDRLLNMYATLAEGKVLYKAVSYTHLDVYKRQGIILPLSAKNMQLKQALSMVSFCRF